MKVVQTRYCNFAVSNSNDKKENDMRKVFSWFVAAFLFAVPLLLTACGSDDEASTDADIIGSWELTASDMSDFWAEYSDWKVGDTMTFSSDGSYSLTSTHSYSEHGKWSLNGNNLRLYDITSSDGAIDLPSTCTCNISGDMMTIYLSALDVTHHFKRK